MIDKTGEYWKSDLEEDIDEYLREYSEVPKIDVKPIVCECGSSELNLFCEQDEGVLEVECAKCGARKFIADSEEYADEVELERYHCPLCGNPVYNARVGFQRRKNGSVKWVYIGNRCVKCKVLGSVTDWKIDYEPTDEMERNV